jgi:hypothetical protein
MRRLLAGWCLGLTAVAFFGALAGGNGCGGGSGQASSCQAACGACPSELCADCSATSARLRDDLESALYPCVKAGGDASCDNLWLGCMYQSLAKLPRRTIDGTYQTACLSKRRDCAAAGTNFADDLCLQSALVAESLVMQAQQCLTMSCSAVSTCLRPIFH